MQILQYVEAGNTKVGQRIKFIDKKAWWKVVDKSDNEIIVKRGRITRRLSRGWKLLQEPFVNL